MPSLGAMSSVEKRGNGGMPAGPGGGSDEPGRVGGSNPERKRRRWSTVQGGHDGELGNRFVRKKQVSILGRQLTTRSSTSSLASFQSNSNPIFEPGDHVDHSLGPDSEALRAFGTRAMVVRSPKSHPTAGNSFGAGAGAEGRDQCDGHPRNFKIMDVETTVLIKDPAEWGRAVDESDHQDSASVLRVSTTRFGGGSWASEEVSCDPFSKVEIHADGALAIPMDSSSDDSSLDCLNPDEEERSSLAACEKRGRELVEKVQANVAAELAQLKAYRAMIAELRAECSGQRAPAGRPTDSQGDVEAQLLAAREDMRKVQCERDELGRRLEIVEAGAREAHAAKAKAMEAVEQERGEWRKKVEALESELSAVTTDRDGLAACLRKSKDAKRESPDSSMNGKAEAKKFKVEADGEVKIISTVASVAYKAVDGSSQNLDSGTPRALNLERVAEVQAQLAATCSEMEKLQTERNELQTAVLNGQKRVQVAEQERDAVVLAVQSEWDEVKVALRKDKEKLKRELEAVHGQKAKMEAELNSTRQLLGQKGVWAESRDLESELAEVRNHNAKLESERKALIGALIGVQDGSEKLEGEMSQVRDEFTRLEGEREALRLLQEERKKLEVERVGVLQAMKGQNKKLESEREVLIAMQAYLEKLETKQDIAVNAGRDADQSKTARKGRQENKALDLPTNKPNVKMLDIKREAVDIKREAVLIQGK